MRGLPYHPSGLDFPHFSPTRESLEASQAPRFVSAVVSILNMVHTAEEWAFDLIKWAAFDH